MLERHHKFGEWLQKLQLASLEEVQAALTLQKQSKDYIGDLLIAAEVISPDTRDAVLSLQKLMSSSTRLADLEVAPEILKRIPPRFARDQSVFPLIQIEQWLVVAMAQPDDQELLTKLAQLTESAVFPVPWRVTDIQEAALIAYDPRRAQQSGMEWIHDELPASGGPLLTFVGSGDATGSGARNQTCLHLQSEEASFLIDCGPTSLTAMKQLGLPVQQLHGMLLTHAHGDHFGGVPFVLLDLMMAGREAPFWIMAPQHLLEHLQNWNELCYPGILEKTPFPIHWLPIEGEPRSIPGTGIMVYPFAMNHQASRLCHGYQVHLPEEKIVAYTGDTAWCDNLELLARDTDLLIAECSYVSSPPEYIKHLAYDEILERKADLKTRHLVLTHMGEEMLKFVAEGKSQFDTAYDGLTIDLSQNA